MKQSTGKRVSIDEFRGTIEADCLKYAAKRDSEIIAARITQSELMGVPSHGLHYFLHSIRPLVRQGHINAADISTDGNVVRSNGDGGVGFRNLEKCLNRASAIAESSGSALIVMRNPGKVGALRLYCQRIMDSGQLIVLLKNTAATVGLPGTKQPIIGTNPLCIGLPDSTFIYDSSISTVATNRMRLNEKYERGFDSPVGIDAHGELTNDASDILQGNGMLLPFSLDQYSFKSFFLGVAIECIAAMAGGKTSIRVGNNTGSRLYSDEGMFGLIVDRKVFPHYSNYLEEMPLLLKDIKAAKVRLPNARRPRKTVTVLRQDWDALRAS